MTHICVSKLTSIGSDNGLSPCRRQVIIWTNAGILLIWPLGTNFSEIFIEIHISSFKKMHLKMSSAKCRPFCLGLNVLEVEKAKQDIINVKILSAHLNLNKYGWSWKKISSYALYWYMRAYCIISSTSMLSWYNTSYYGLNRPRQAEGCHEAFIPKHCWWLEERRALNDGISVNKPQPNWVAVSWESGIYFSWSPCNVTNQHYLRQGRKLVSHQIDFISMA